MITVTFARWAREWRQEVGERAKWECEAIEHHPDCKGVFQQAHHAVFKAHLTTESLWIVENGISLSQVCHAKAHAEHNANLSLQRINAAVEAVNCVDKVKVRKFTKGCKP